MSAKGGEGSFKTKQKIQNETDSKPAICMTVRMSKDGFFIEENGGNLHKIAVFLHANDIFLCEL